MVKVLPGTTTWIFFVSTSVWNLISLVENIATALFFSNNHVDLRRWSAAEGQAGYSGMCEETLRTYDYTAELGYK